LTERRSEEGPVMAGRRLRFEWSDAAWAMLRALDAIER
jgi:hypothetical protein